MSTYKVKENLSIGKDTYDILDENEQLLYKVKGKMINVGGAKLKVYDSSEKEIAELSSNMRKNSWKLTPIDEGQPSASYTIKGFFGKKFTLMQDDKVLEGKVRRANMALASLDGMELYMKKNLAFKDVYTVEAPEEIDPMCSTISAVVYDQVFREGSNDSKGFGILRSILGKFI